MRLPRYVHQRPSGTFRYKRNVPKRLLSLVGKSHVYRYLGASYEEMILKLPIAHSEVERLFQGLQSTSPNERTLAFVRQRFGDEAADQLQAGDIDENLEMGLWALHQELEVEDAHDAEIVSNLVGANLPGEVVTLAKAFALYADFKDAESNRKLANNLAKVQTDLKAAIGNHKLSKQHITTLERDDARAYRDFLHKRVAPNSVVRYLNVVRAVINFATSELGLDMNNPFHNLPIKGAGQTANDRHSLSPSEAQAGFDTLPDRADLRAIYLLLWETGARVAEITGLQVRDIDKANSTLHIRSNDIRGLKTISSKRRVPLSKEIMVALEEIIQELSDTDPLFERYGRPKGNTAASAIVMKHLRKTITDPKKTLHSLRHKKKDDLRNVGCPEEISKVILGHSSQEVAARYGAGYNMDTLRDWMNKSHQQPNQ